MLSWLCIPKLTDERWMGTSQQKTCCNLLCLKMPDWPASDGSFASENMIDQWVRLHSWLWSGQLLALTLTLLRDGDGERGSGFGVFPKFSKFSGRKQTTCVIWCCIRSWTSRGSASWFGTSQTSWHPQAAVQRKEQLETELEDRSGRMGYLYLFVSYKLRND